MSVQQTYLCDVCGKPKGEGNGWWMAYVSTRGEEISVAHWSLGDRCSGFFDLCGEACVHAYLSKWMEGK